MTIKAPAPYSTLKAPVVFEVERETADAVEVNIEGYIKHMTGEKFAVNVSDYFIGKIDPRPILSPAPPAADFVYFEGKKIGRACDVSITVDGTAAAPVECIYSDVPLPTGKFLTDLRRRRIRPDDVEEVAIIGTSTDPLSVILKVENKVIPSGYGILALRPYSPGAARAMVQCGNERIEYDFAAHAGVRLAWINRYGAIDYWNFDVENEHSIEVEKERIYTEDGYRVTQVTAEERIKVCSKNLDRQTLEALTRILVSERVWLIEGATYREIDVLTESARVYSRDDLSALELEYRPIKRMI